MLTVEEQLDYIEMRHISHPHVGRRIALTIYHASREIPWHVATDTYSNRDQLFYLFILSFLFVEIDRKELVVVQDNKRRLYITL